MLLPLACPSGICDFSKLFSFFILVNSSSTSFLFCAIPSAFFSIFSFCVVCSSCIAVIVLLVVLSTFSKLSSFLFVVPAFSSSLSQFSFNVFSISKLFVFVVGLSCLNNFKFVVSLILNLLCCSFPHIASYVWLQ